VITWTSPEVSVGLFCASALCIIPLVRKTSSGLLVSVSRTSIGSSRRRDGTSKTNGHANGTATFGSQRGTGEVYELKSADESDFGREAQPREGNTFWVRSDSDEGTEESTYDAARTGDGRLRRLSGFLCREGTIRKTARQHAREKRVLLSSWMYNV
jgi:hypothetical protein